MKPSKRASFFLTSGRPGAARAGNSRRYTRRPRSSTATSFRKVDTEDQQELAREFGITSIPTVMAFRDGVRVFSQPGALPKKQLEDLISQVEGLDMDDVRRKIEESKK